MNVVMVFAEVLKNLSNPIVWTLLSFSLIHFKDFRNLVPRILSLLRGRERTLGTRLRLSLISFKVAYYSFIRVQEVYTINVQI